MALELTANEIDALWEQGYRPYEIYTTNPEPVFYCDMMWDAGTITGWGITFVFAKRETLEKSYPFFDAIIGVDSLAYCNEVFHG